jgi:hypothetical protein
VSTRSQRIGRRLASLAAVAAVFAIPATAAANLYATIRFEHVSLDGASPSWRPVNLFSLSWSAPTAPDPYTVDYLFRDSSGTAISPLSQSVIGTSQLSGIRIPVPPGLSSVPPGEYAIELWAEGSKEPHSLVPLGFDDKPPTAVSPLAPTEWLRAGSYAEVAIEHPVAPLPVSGIRGYAFLLDHSLAGQPCAGPDRCTKPETDLDGGVGDDLIRIGPLLEETNVVRVAAVSNSGVRSSQAGSATLHVDGTPPRIAFHGLPDSWSNQPVRVTAVATDPLSGTSASGPEGPLTALGVDGGMPTVVLGGQAPTTVQGDGYHLLRATARDAVGNATDEAQPVRATIRIDETPPRVFFNLERNPVEPERIVAAVSDALSGPAPHGSIAIRPASSNQGFQPLPTVGGGGRLTALWDSDSYPPGNYEFKATAYDLAGNATGSELRADGSPMVLSNPVKTPTAIAFGFGGKRLVWHRCERSSGGLRCHRKTIVAYDRRPITRTVPFGHGIPVSGRLTSATGAPLPGLPVEVGETFSPGSSPQRRTTTVLTGADGSFLARLAPGPNRQIAVGFAGTRLLTRTAGRTLQLGVRGRVRLHATDTTAAIGGAPVVFKGKVDHHDAAIPSTGLAVELQFQVLGSPWSEFRTVQTDAFGRFSYPYAFSDDDSRGIRFQFRAVVPEQAGWPYESGASRPVAITGL